MTASRGVLPAPQPTATLRLLHLGALNALAIAQPTFAALAGHAAFFAFRASSPLEIALTVMLLLAVLPLALWGAARLVGRWAPRAEASLHLAWVALFLAALLLPPLRRAGLGTAIPIASAALLTAAYARWASARSFVTMLAPALLVCPTWFLLQPDLVRLLRARPHVAALDISISRPVPVVLIVLDELSVGSLLAPDGRIDHVRYPNFARLARLSTWYPRATSAGDWTGIALPALLTGRYPERYLLPIAAEYPHNLFTLLGNTHAIRAIELTELCPPALCGGAGRDDSPLPMWGDVAALAAAQLVAAPTGLDRDGIAAQSRRDLVDFAMRRIVPASLVRRAHAAQFVTALTPDARPTLYYLHLMLPHSPYEILPSGKAYRASNWGRDASWRWTAEAHVVAVAEQRYLAQLGYVDGLLGQMLDRMASTGLLDLALLIVTADHGVAFLPGHSHRFADGANLAEIAGVPLFVKRPDQRAGTIDETPVSTVDILPTIADELGVEAPWPMEGVSLLRAAPRRRARSLSTLRDHRRAGQAVRRIALDPTRIDHAPAIGRRAARFGSGEAPSALRLLSPLDALRDRPLETLAVVPDPGPYLATVHLPSSPVHYDPGGANAPVWIEGHLSGPQAAQAPVLVIAVNGVVRALAPTLAVKGGWMFFALLDESVLAPGVNTVAIYLANDSPSGLPLRALATA